MQDPSLYSQIKSQSQPQFPEQEHLKCPRCNSPNTKFCYYNNYNLSQPRHFCKSCRRYWTKGGALRNIPVGGGSRKHTKRSSSSSSSAAAIKRPAASNSKNDTIKTSNGENPETLQPQKGENFGGQFGNFLQEGSGSSFTSLLGTSGGQFGNFLDGLGPGGPSLQINGHFGDPVPGQNVDTAVGNADGFLNIHGGDESGNGDDNAAAAACWTGNSNGWPDLAMYTPGSNFQ